MAKKAKVQRKKRVVRKPEPIIYSSQRDVDVGFGGVPIRPAVIQQAQQQNIQSTIGNTNLLLGRLKAQQVNIEKELERIKKQEGAIIDKPTLQEFRQPLKAIEVQTEPNLPRTVGGRKAFISGGTSIQEDVFRDVFEQQKRVRGNLKEVYGLPRSGARSSGFQQLEAEDLSQPMASSTRQQLEEEISSTSRAIIGRTGFMEAESTPMPRAPTTLRPLGQITRASRFGSEEEQQNVGGSIRQRVLDEQQRENVDLRGFGIRAA
jgi:uncharacterized protein YhaN